jgi:hypothetical protein
MTILSEIGKGTDSVSVRKITNSGDAHWKGVPTWTIHRFNDEDGKIGEATKNGMSAELASKLFADKFVGKSTVEGNLLLDGGITIMWTLIATTGTQFDFGNSRLGVGDDSTAANSAQDQLNPTVSGNVRFNLIDGGFPIVTAQTVAYQATYASSEANFDWNEFGVDNDQADGAGTSIASYSTGVIGLMNRLVSSQGTKISGQTWILTLSIVLS